MKKTDALLLFLVAVPCGVAQYPHSSCCISGVTPAQMDWSNRMFDTFPADRAPANRPTGETVSLARLSHNPPRKAQDAFFRGLKFDTNRDFLRAAEEFEKAVALDPGFSEAYGNLGVEYTALGRLDEALNAYQHALALDPATSYNHSNLAYALIRIQRETEAEAELQTALGLDSNNARAHLLLGYLWALNPEKRNRAETHLVYAARTMPEGHYLLAKMYAAEGAADSARAEMARFRETAVPPSKRRAYREQSFLPTH